MRQDARLVTRWTIVFAKQAQKDAAKLKAAGLKAKAEKLLDLIQADPFQISPPYEKLIGDLAGTYSRRINIQHRLVYAVDQKTRSVKILRMWTHYE